MGQNFLSEQVLLLYQLLEKMKTELATTKYPKQGAERIDKVCDQLGEVIKETEGAVMTIMTAIEDIELAVNSMSSQIRFQGAAPVWDRINRRTQEISEACTFQDIAGQRLNRALNSMLMIEGTINSLVAIVGSDGMEKVVSLTDDESVPMDGPALYGQGMDQSDIDVLFI